MEIRLIERWGSRLQGDIVSVSPERAAALVEAGVGRYVVEPPLVVEEAPVVEEAVQKKSPGRPKK